MEGYIDIHNHILPLIDDGSRSIEQTKSMLKIAYMEGIRSIIVTPHYHEVHFKNSIQTINDKLKEVQEQIRTLMPQMELYTGSEIYFSHSIIKLLNENMIPTMAGSRYILVEFSTTESFRNINNNLKELLLEGYIPIIAHIERYHDIVKDFNQVEELIETGAYIQVNAMSILGQNGRNSQSISKKLLNNNWVHFVATDAHSDGVRSPRLNKCANYIVKKYGKDYVSELLIDNPNKVLNNEYI